MEVSGDTAGPPSLKDNVYIKKYLRYTRKYVVVEFGALYYYAKPNSVKPEFYTPLEGFKVHEKGLSHGKLVIKLLSRKKKVKIGFDDQARYKLWLETLRGITETPLTKRDSSSTTIVVQPRTSILDRFQALPAAHEWLNSVSSKDFILVGVRGDSLHYQESLPSAELTQPNPNLSLFLVILPFLFSFSVNPYVCMAISLSLALYVYSCAPVSATPPSIESKLRSTVQRPLAEVIKFLTETHMRVQWAPLVIQSTDSSMKLATGVDLEFSQQFVRLSECYYIIEKHGENRHVFQLKEVAPRLTEVIHYVNDSQYLDWLPCFAAYLNHLQKTRAEELETGAGVHADEWEMMANGLINRVKNDQGEWQTQVSEGCWTRNYELCLKGQIQGSLQQVFHVTTEITNRGLFSELFESGYLLEMVGENMDLLYYKTKNNNNDLEREYSVVQKRVQVKPDEYYILCFSNEHAEVVDPHAVKSVLSYEIFHLQGTNPVNVSYYIRYPTLQEDIPKLSKTLTNLQRAISYK